MLLYRRIYGYIFFSSSAQHLTLCNTIKRLFANYYHKACARPAERGQVRLLIYELIAASRFTNCR